MKKIFMFVNVDWFFYSHRLPIANASREHDINMFVFTDITDKETNQTPSEYRMVQSPLTRKLNNPWSLFSEFLSALSLIYREKPDVIHAVTIKPILFMGLIARLTKTPFIAAISGFGPVMEQNNFIKKLRFKMVLLIYRFIFSSETVNTICQNENDKNILLQHSLCDKSKITIIPGSGVDLKKFKPSTSGKTWDTVLMASRILKDKGVEEYCSAAKLFKKTDKRNVKFMLAGPIDKSSPSSISEEDINKLCLDSDVEYLGAEKDLENLLASSSIFVLPSYYAEGVPKVLLEASACGIPIITTDHPGCRDAIINNETGLLVKIRDSEAIYRAIKYMFDNPQIMEKMGKAGRELAENSYNESEVVNLHYAVYSKVTKK
tara:strand:- start:627 stop:1754 length:1128 start_codon:yes stop_codon:yes gene_type:complete